MKTLCDNIPILPSGSRFADFLTEVENPDEIDRGLLEMCVPEGFAVSEEGLENIRSDRCFGCLSCIDAGDARFITSEGVPTNDEDNNVGIEDVFRAYFRGSYVRSLPALRRLSTHTSTDETRRTNPLAAIYMWRLSEDPAATFVACSPSWEVSLDTADPLDEREGHLDVVVCSTRERLVCVLEGKKSLESLLSDVLRDQWNRYYGELLPITERTGFELIFSYVIGGEELGLYPDSSNAPFHGRRAEFYEFISRDNKRFISIESLRALKAWQISIDNGWNWEEWFSRLFIEEDSVGLLSGGVVRRRGDEYFLEECPWV